MILYALVANQQVFCDDRVPVISPASIPVRVQHWTTEDGLPNQVVNSIAQTPDGYIWFAGFSRFTRFDGIRFRVFNNFDTPGLGGVLVTNLHVDGQGNLWIRGGRGEVGWFSGDKITLLDQSNGMPKSGASTVSIDQSGRLWFKERFGNGFFYVEGLDRVVKVDYLQADAQDYGSFQPIGDGQSTFAIERDTRCLVRLSLDSIPVQCHLDTGDTIQVDGLFRAASGDVGLSSAAGNRIFDGEQWRTLFDMPEGQPRPKNATGDGGTSGGGLHYMGTTLNGLIVSPNPDRVGELPLGSSEEAFIRAAITDREGTVWVGKSDGLFRISHIPFRQLGEEDGLDSNTIFAVVESSAREIWIGTREQIFRKREGDKGFTPINIPGHSEFRFLAAPPVGKQMFMANRSNDVLQWKNGEVETIGTAPASITSMEVDSDGVLWIGTKRGLYQYSSEDANGLKRVERFRSIHVADIRLDQKTRLHVSVAGLGVFRQEIDQWIDLSDPKFPATKIVRSISFDPDNSLWALTGLDAILVRRNEQWFKPPGFMTERLTGVHNTIHDNKGSTWLPSLHGLHRIERNDVLNDEGWKWSDRITYYREYGLGSSSFIDTKKGGAVDSHGRIWIGTQRGLSVADTNVLREMSYEKCVAKPILEEVFIDQVPFDLKEAGKSVSLTPDSHLFEIAYTATGFRNPERGIFRYRIPTLSDDWVGLGSQRKVSLLKPFPGQYALEIQAGDGDSNWSDEILSISLRVERHWWQKLSFRLPFAIALISLIVLIIYSRHRKNRAEKEVARNFSRVLLHVQEVERKSVAEELHDSIGHELLLIKSRIDRNKVGNLVELKDGLLQSLSDSVGEAIQQVKHLSKGLCPPLLDQMGLTSALDSMVEDVSETTGIPIRFLSENIDDLVTSESGISIYRIVQEALNNIVSHSKASEASVEIRKIEGSLVVKIEDDGCGIQRKRDELSKGGSGLRFIAERVELMNGKFEINSERGRGTLLILTLPDGI